MRHFESTTADEEILSGFDGRRQSPECGISIPVFASVGIPLRQPGLQPEQMAETAPRAPFPGFGSDLR